MQKLYQVFLSSTFEDLREERRHVIEALLSLDCFPAAMEYFNASDDDQWSYITKVIDNCDYYVVIVAGRLGSIDAKTGVSFTEKEYDYAVASGKPVLGFVHGDPGKLLSANTDRDPEKIKKLQLFRDKVKSRMCKFWTSPEDLAGKVSHSLAKLKQDRPGIGWVRGDVVADKGETERLALKVEHLQRELAASRELKIDRSKLASGADRFKLPVVVTSVDNSEWGQPIRKEHASNFDYSWDEMFAKLAPSLLGWKSESFIRDTLRAIVSLKAGTDGRNIRRSYHVPMESVHLVLLQFYALGLVARSHEPEPVKSEPTLWRLTSPGEQHLMEIAPLPKSE